MSTVADITRRLHHFAPTGLAESWDNVGLQLGNPALEVTRVLVTLDVTPNVAAYAIENSFDLIVSHHPFIFRPLHAVTDTLMLELAQHRIAVLCAHTNLDSARGGVSHVTGVKLGLKDMQVLTPAGEWLHVAVYVPEDAVERVMEAAFNAGAGRIGSYSGCMNRYPVIGQFQGDIGSHPFVGSPGKTETVDEAKLEFFCEGVRLSETLSAIRGAHPYETPAIAVYPQKQPSPNTGMGVVGTLEAPMALSLFADHVKSHLGVPFVRLWNSGFSLDKPISRVALCGGSGGSMVAVARARADVFVTGDITYHTCLDAKMPLIDAGHFHTEAPVLEALVRILDRGDARFEVFPAEKHEIGQLSVR
jgi:dinuclear metal center YbgI/SA1388 family protein